MTKLLACLGGLVALVTLLAVTVAVNGYVLMTLWGWFVVPIFRLPTLRLVDAVGLTSVIGFLMYNRSNYKKLSGKDSAIEILNLLITRPVLSLFFGWLIHRWM